MVRGDFLVDVLWYKLFSIAVKQHCPKNFVIGLVRAVCPLETETKTGKLRKPTNPTDIELHRF